eukprot:Skav214981  [mRNA]  locus=scaffold508:147289:149361:- [translate_table: standard]
MWALASEDPNEYCHSFYQSCKIGLPVGPKAPGKWSYNSSVYTAKVSRAGRPWRRGQRQSSKEAYGMEFAKELARKRHATIAIHEGHDANIAVAVGGRIQCVLELERLFGRRYYHPSDDPFIVEWPIALQVVRDKCECEDGPCPAEFDTGIILGFAHAKKPHTTRLAKIVERTFPVKTWRSAHHHESHALMAYYSSPFRSALVVSYDGGGDDGYWNVFVGQGLDVYRVGRELVSPVPAYTRLASFLPAVTGAEQYLPELCASVRNSPKQDWSQVKMFFSLQERLSFAGKLMGYSGIRGPSTEASEWIRQFYDRVINATDDDGSFPQALLLMICRGEDERQALAASAQDEFSKVVQPKIAEHLLQLKSESIDVEGIVLTGGGALNVLTNQLVRETLTSFTSGVDSYPSDVYVPPSPGDSGLSVGAIWSLFPPTVRQPLQYLGFRLFDEKTLEDEARKRGAQKISDLGGVEYLAELLAGGPAWQKIQKDSLTAKPIMAVVRGRQEFGPRALGHRSLLAFPDSIEMCKRMNRIKFRQWWRPAAPMIADEALEYVFGHKFRSAYMEFAPLVREEVRQRFPGLAHFDGTARHQSVGKQDEPWVHALLLAVGKRTGLAALINTSFNSRGKPITNTVKESLGMLDTLEGLDFVLIEDWLFGAPAVRKRTDVSQSSPSSKPTLLNGKEQMQVSQVHHQS